jgi:hypothetical protein
VIVGSQKNVALTRRKLHIFLMVFGSGRIAIARLERVFEGRVTREKNDAPAALFGGLSLNCSSEERRRLKRPRG